MCDNKNLKIIFLDVDVHNSKQDAPEYINISNFEQSVDNKNAVEEPCTIKQEVNDNSFSSGSIEEELIFEEEKQDTICESVQVSSKLYPCIFCDYKTDKKRYLNQHQNVHTEVKPFSCTFCDYKSKKSSNISRHMKTHKDEKSLLDGHLKNLTGEKRSICRSVDGTFSKQHVSEPEHINSCELLIIKEENQDEICANQQLFSCTSCDYTTNKKRYLTEHRKVHTEIKPFSCTFCDYKSKKSSNITRHMRIHKDEKSFLDDHLKNHTGEMSSKCNSMADTFSKQDVPESEYINVSLPVTEDNENAFEEQYTLIKQEVYNSSCDLLSLKHEEFIIKEENQVKNQKLFSCTFCTYKTNQKRYLSEHRKVHTDEKPFHCTYCDYKCKKHANLVRHIRIHTGEKPYICTICNDKWIDKTSLNRHVRTHTGEKLLKCTVCHYECVKKEDLTRHIQTAMHVKGLMFSCTFCNYKTGNKNYLTDHKRIHTDKKPYKCTVCEYECKKKSNLIRHTKNHTGEKPFSCAICGFKFTDKTPLYRHLQTHTEEKRFNCTLCDYKCVKRGDLTRHLRIHNGEKPYSCHVCGYKCSRKENLNVHVKKRHPEQKLLSCTERGEKFVGKSNLMCSLKDNCASVKKEVCFIKEVHDDETNEEFFQFNEQNNFDQMQCIKMELDIKEEL